MVIKKTLPRSFFPVFSTSSLEYFTITSKTLILKSPFERFFVNYLLRSFLENDSASHHRSYTFIQPYLQTTSLQPMMNMIPIPLAGTRSNPMVCAIFCELCNSSIVQAQSDPFIVAYFPFVKRLI